MFLELIIISSLFPFFYFEGHKILYNKILHNWYRFRELNTLVETTHKNEGYFKGTFLTFLDSSIIVVKMYWRNFMQWCHSSVEIIDKNNVCITYNLNGKEYKVLVANKKGPHKICLITDGENDITDLVLPYAGPKEDWHGTMYTPAFWKRKMIIIHYKNGTTKSYHDHEVIENSLLTDQFQK